MTSVVGEVVVVGCGVVICAVAVVAAGQLARLQLADSTKGWQLPPRDRIRLAVPQLAVHALQLCQTPQELGAAAAPVVGAAGAAVVATGQAPELQDSESCPLSDQMIWVWVKIKPPGDRRL